MTIDEKIGKTLEELEVRDAASVETLFGEVSGHFEAELQEAFSVPASDYKALRDRWLSRKHGLVARIDEHWLKAAPKGLKPAVGRKFNGLRQEIEGRFVPGSGSVSSVSLSREVHHDLMAEAEDVILPDPNLPDLTLPGNRRPFGSIHPVTRVQREIEEIFLGLGFTIETGPEIESVYYNYDALNIPESHPSRDDVDTLYIDSKTLLRTHTSPVQIRAMQKYGAPLYVIAPGKCYRRDNPDATHSPMFHQIEGLAVDCDITFADLKGTLDFFAKKFFGERVRTSFRPTYFPFTEPSGEVAVSCIACGGEGCRV
ncbi:MAG TPA: phenylalanine--tRNA ligase subunit alpha, partial [Terriglobia bacterium]|nr:phenylalanine--tRNA ligase subunit alpha [Terriglobia bacterium]